MSKPFEQVLLADPFPCDIESPSLLNFYSIWQVLDPDLEQPRVGALDLISLGDHIPLTFVFDHNNETGRFQIRFMGSEYHSKIGCDYTGQYVDQNDSLAKLLEILWGMVVIQRPYLARNMQLPQNISKLTHCNFIACPFFDDEGNVCEIWLRMELERKRNDHSPDSIGWQKPTQLYSKGR